MPMICFIDAQMNARSFSAGRVRYPLERPRADLSWCRVRCRPGKISARGGLICMMRISFYDDLIADLYFKL